MRGVKITTLLHKDSVLEWDDIKQISYNNEHNEIKLIRDIANNNFDVILDFSHHHILSREYVNDKLPIINFIHDEECSYMPPNCLVGNKWQTKKYPLARIVATGINIKKYKLYENKEDYYSFCGKIEHRKGYDIANNISLLANVKTIFAGPNVDGNANILPHWIGEITDHNQLCDFVGKSKCLFYPSRADAGGMGIWEAAAMGTPVITTIDSGAQCNVVHKQTGFVCNNINEAVNYTHMVSSLNPQNIRKVCEERWDLNKNFDNIYQQIINFCHGERW
jgi:glycosyltransferase involved in cell wall biosynthesis